MKGILVNWMEISLSMGCLAGIVLICTPLWNKRYTARWRYWVWLVIALRLLIPLQPLSIQLPAMENASASGGISQEKAPQTQDLPAEDLPLPSYPQVILPDEAEGTVHAALPEKSDTTVWIPRQETALEPPVWETLSRTLKEANWMQVLSTVWLLGAAVSLCVRLVSYRNMRRVLRAYARPNEDEWIQEVFRQVAEEMGYNGPLALVDCPVVRSPMVCGIIKPVLLLPRKDYPEETLKMVFRHELVHVMRRDLWYKLVMLAASVVHWFNPLVHWMMRAADRDLEISCDEAVIRARDNDFRAQYGEAILQVLHQSRVRPFVLSTSFCDQKKTLMQRFSAIFDKGKKRRGTAVMALVLLFALLAGCLSVGQEHAVPSEDGLSASSSEPETVPMFSEEDLEQMRQTAFSYERFCWGREWQPEEEQEPDWYRIVDFGNYVLGDHGLLDAYYNEEWGYYSVQEGKSYSVGRLFFGNAPQSHEIPGMDNEDNIHNFDYDHIIEEELPFELEEMEVTEQEDGTVAISYRRKAKRSHLFPVEYRFQKAEIQEVPEDLAGIFQPGDTVWQILSVKDLPMEMEPGYETIEIATAEDLVAAAERINAGGWVNQYDTYVLTADIDMTGVDFTPMGLNEKVLGHSNDDDVRDPTLRGFNGVFDGQGHTIRGLSVDAADLEHLIDENYSFSGAGLFALIGDDGHVRDLNLVDCHVTAPFLYNGTWYGNVGLLAGQCGGAAVNVSVQGTVEGSYGVGGFAGSFSGYAQNCSADVTVTGFREVGAFAGSTSYGYLEDCTAVGQVIADSPEDAKGRDDAYPISIGGFTGFSVEGSVYQCDSSVYISTLVPANWVGAFIGYAQSFTAENCTYDQAKAPNWEAVDVLYQTTEDFVEPDIRPR